MAEQKMTDEQLSQKLHKSKGGRAGGKLLSLFGGIVIVCGIMSAATLKEQQEQPAAMSTQTIAIRKCSSASMNMTRIAARKKAYGMMRPLHPMRTGGNRNTAPHICDEESGCISQKLNCRHKQDDECGYSPATRGTPCEFAWDGKEK